MQTTSGPPFDSDQTAQICVSEETTLSLSQKETSQPHGEWKANSAMLAAGRMKLVTEEQGLGAPPTTRAGASAGDEAASIERLISRGEHRAAIARCAQAYGPALGRLCMSFLGSQAEADELAQETLLLAFDAFPQFRGEGTVKAFIFGIARKTCARALETRSRREAKLRLVSDGVETTAPDAAELAAKRVRALKARAALEQLKPTEREALLLRFDGDLSFREVAAACGCDEPTARKRVSRALIRMREVLRDEL